MGGKEQDGSAASSALLPLAKQLRRASVTSITSLFDKQALNQTLDQIHNSASQSDTLTTFNDYAPPPSSASTSDTKKQQRPASPTGIGSWYNRVRGTVVPKGTTQNTLSIATPRPQPTSASQSAPRTPEPGVQPETNIKKSDEIAVESVPGSPESRRFPSKPSERLKPAEDGPALSSSDKVIVHNPSNRSAQSSSHKHVLSNSSHTSLGSGQDLRKESFNGREVLKRSMTPDPGPPSSPLLSADGGSRKAMSIALTQVPSRTGSVSSTTSVQWRRDDGANASRTNHQDMLDLEVIPKLSRFASNTESHKNGASKDSSTFTDVAEEDENTPSNQEGQAKIVRHEDAMAALKRLQTQGLGSSASRDPQAQAVGTTINQLRNRVLSRQYWMKDENARDCFYCGDSFSTFRRKHHCRTCGQIFDAKCMTDVPGASFGQSGKIRVCKPCEGLINGYEDSSDYTDDDTSSIMTGGPRRRHNSKENGDTSPLRPSTPNTPGLRHLDHLHHGSRNNLNTFKSHHQGPLSRRIDDLKRNSGQFDDDSDRRSIRPMTSRSMKSSHGMRPHTGHRRHHSKHLLQRTPRNPDFERAPFYQDSERSHASGDKLPAFHSDNVIDPELADFLSDDGDSDEEEQSIAGALHGSKLSASNSSHAAQAPSTPFLKRPPSRYGDRLLGSRRSDFDFDTASMSSGKNYPVGHLRRRNVSFTGSALLGSPPKPQRFTVAAQQWSSPSFDGIYGNTDGTNDEGMMIRSISLQGARAPSIELNNASLQHGQRLLRQMLEEFSVHPVDVWEKALMPIMLRATDDVLPNVQDGDAINITNYVKLKKVPGGKPSDTGYISGVVFSKNLALKSMPRKISRPHILILTFALEYSRAEAHFMSLEPVIRQEREYLQNLVKRISALGPHLILVQRNVSGLALDLLQKANIAVAHNVKRSVLEAISRCCQSRIITSMDKLATLADSQSTCESFYLRSFAYEGQRKSYMYFSGCPKELGCTIVLRGASTPVLRRVKRIAEFIIQAIYNLRLETSLMRDEFALMPHYGAEGTIRYHNQASPTFSTVLSNGRSTQDAPVIQLNGTNGSHSQSLGETESEDKTHSNTGDFVEEEKATSISEKPVQDIPDDIPAPTFYSDLVDNQRTRILSTSPFVKFMQPYLLMRARESETRLTHLKRLLDQDAEELAKSQDAEPDKFSLIAPEMINETVKGASRKVREILQAVHESEYDKTTHIYQTQAKQWESSVAGNSDMFNPLSHQSITVLHSLIRTATSIACSGPDVFTIRFYDDHTADHGNEPDCTLGQYVEDTCVSADAICGYNGCDKKLCEHKRQYVHGEGMLEVTILRSPSKAPGLEDIPLMWSVCRKCGQETQTVPMSENTWNYSFGKYLELAFWSIPLRPRANICSHDLHRDYWRYFGYHNWALRFQYDSVNLLEVIVPRTRITWKVVNDLKFKNENFRRAEKRLNKFINSVRERLKSIRPDTLAPDNMEQCKLEIDRLMDLINQDSQALHTKLQEKYVNSKFYEIVPFNRALRFLHEKAGEWDEIFQDVELNFFPSEKDISRLASLQIKKMFLDREDSGTTLASPDGTASASFTDELGGSDVSPETELNSASSSRILSPEKARDLLTSVVEDNAKGVQTNTSEDFSQSLPVHPNDQPSTPPDMSNPVVSHLDLAVSPMTSPKPPASPARSQTFGSPLLPSPIPRDLPADDTDVKTKTMSASNDGTITSTDNEQDANTGVTKKKPKASAIPRFADLARRRTNLELNTSQQRSQSQPGNGRQILKALSSQTNTPQRSPVAANFENSTSENATEFKMPQRPSQRFSLASMKERGQSFIPRSIANKRSTRVSALTKHFEQLSKEFERQRQKDQKQRASRHRQAGAYPAAALKPIVEVYRNVHEAISEPHTDHPSTQQENPGDMLKDTGAGSTAKGAASNLMNVTHGDGFHAEGTTADHSEVALETSAQDPETEDAEPEKSTLENLVAAKIQDENDGEDDVIEEKLEEATADDEQDQEPAEEGFDPELELRKHEKTSLMKMLTNFWAERSSSGWTSLYYPLRDVDHVFANSDIIVREDEPSSLVALALDHGDYQTHLKSIGDQSATTGINMEKQYIDDMFLSAEEQRRIERSLLQDTGHHLSYQFERSSAKMQCKIFWAEQFEAVRTKCGVSERIVESLSRCLKWDSKGGKTKSVFLKTLDDRFVLKSLSPVETRSFLHFAPYYFKLMSQALFHELPSLIAKMLGFYQVTIKNPVTGTDFDWYLLLMENLFYDRSPAHIFDLKGSMRNRRITPSGSQNEVLLDENMVDFIAEHPLFSREHSKKLLRSSIYNDTLFLAKRNVMDYSLMLGIDEREGRSELVVGIIDCIRTYTWDKQLETWVKGRGKNRPTVTEPRDYKNRFREAINRYVMEAPTCWHFPGQTMQLVRGLPRGETSLTERDDDATGTFVDSITADDGA